VTQPAVSPCSLAGFMLISLRLASSSGPIAPAERRWSDVSHIDFALGSRATAPPSSCRDLGLLSFATENELTPNLVSRNVQSGSRVVSKWVPESVGCGGLMGAEPREWRRIAVHAVSSSRVTRNDGRQCPLPYKNRPAPLHFSRFAASKQLGTEGIRQGRFDKRS